MSDLKLIGGAKKKNVNLESQLFYVALMVNGKTYHVQNPLSAPNQESLAAVMSAIVAINIPQVTGFELYRHNSDYEQNREFLMYCPVMDVMMGLQPTVQQLVGKQVFKAAVPVKGSTANGENLQALFDEAKKAGKQIIGG
jgi:hypothetical protein